MKNQFFNQELRNAEENFYGVGGEMEDFMAVNADYGVNSYLQADAAAAAPAGAPVASEIPDFSRVISMTVSNPLGGIGDTPVTIGFANQNLTSATFGLPPTVTVSVEESSYVQWLQMTLNSNFSIAGFRISAASLGGENPLKYRQQLRQRLQISKANPYGVQGLYSIQPFTYLNLAQQIDFAIDITPYRITWTGETGMTFNLLDGCEVTFEFFTKTQNIPDHHLHGRPVVGVAPAPLPIGTMQKLALTESSAQAIGAAIAMNK